MNSCVVCHTEYLDTAVHIYGESDLTDKGTIRKFVDQDHADYYIKVASSHYDEPCYCTGDITTAGEVDNNETFCNKCKFTWDLH